MYKLAVYSMETEITTITEATEPWMSGNVSDHIMTLHIVINLLNLSVEDFKS